MARHFQELRVYEESFGAAMDIFVLSKGFPQEERYALTDQIRRSSRSVCANIAEAWRKRLFPNHFISKLTDADSEAAETQNWLKFARPCGYLEEEPFCLLWHRYDLVSSSLYKMIQHPETWCPPRS